MKINFKFKKKIKAFSCLCIFLFIFIFQVNSPTVNSLSMDDDTLQNQFITEELRLKVPADLRNLWLEAEKNVWEPWLTIQEGYIGRQIFWDKEKEEALILVNWKNRKLWKSISMEEVNKLQEKFETRVKRTLDISENPFKLIYEGELYKQR